MSTMNPLTPRHVNNCLFTILFIILSSTISIQLVKAQSSQVVSQILFSESLSVPGWTQSDIRNFSTHVDFYQDSNATQVPAPFRTFVRRDIGFSYHHSLPTGFYNVHLGFVEMTLDICKRNIRKRQFYTSVNNIQSIFINIFDAVGCFQPYIVKFSNVFVSSDNLLQIKLTATDSRYPPLLCNAIVVSLSSENSPSNPASPLPTSSPRPSQLFNVFSLDTGSPSDNPSLVQGESSVMRSKIRIAGVPKSQYSRFASYRYGSSFKYVIPVSKKSIISVTLSFAESLSKGCQNQYRLFDVYAHDFVKPMTTGLSKLNLNVFAEAGCRTAYVLNLGQLQVTSGKLVIQFISKKGNAMISAIDLFSSAAVSPPPTVTSSSLPSTTPTPSNKPIVSTPPSPSANPNPNDQTVQIDVGASDDIPPEPASATKRISTDTWVWASALIDSFTYKTARVGKAFQYRLNLQPGGYLITLGFAEIQTAFCSDSNPRVFNVFVNGLLQFEGYDVYAKAGCLRGMERFIKHSVSVVGQKPLIIRFEGVVGEAILNFLSIRPLPTLCTPESSSGRVDADHAAHAVPGVYPPQLSPNSPVSYVDADGDGFHLIQIDGGKSHTHYFDPETNLAGRLTGHTWTLVETGDIISTELVFTWRFPLGVTRLKLTVIDNSCSTDEAETIVTVTGSTRPGLYCYFYNNFTEVPVGGALEKGPWPNFATTIANLNFPFSGFKILGNLFAMRCQLLLQSTVDLPSASIKLATFGTGRARVYKGKDLLIDTFTSAVATTPLHIGLTAFEITYLRLSKDSRPKLRLNVNDRVPKDNAVFHDQSMIAPILTSLSPAVGQVSGGTTVKISGYGLFQPLRVVFGDSNLRVLGSTASTTEFLVSTDPSATGVVDVYVISSSGLRSNTLTFRYGSSCDSIAFRVKRLRSGGRKRLPFSMIPTSVELWQDGKLYFGTLDGSVQVLGYDRQSLAITSRCYSRPLVDKRFLSPAGDPAIRSILGITFHPADKEPRAYVSTSTLYPHSKARIDLKDKTAWRNGAVDRLKPGSESGDPNVCLVYDTTIVKNLPVSNHDHSVSSLVFTQDGDLLIGAGGMTNAGLPGYKLGSWWETDLSAAVLIARLNKPQFQGAILYNSDDQYKARKISGDVETYATGTRNPFAMTMTSTGDVYATDQGANCGFGQIAGSCSAYDEETAATWDSTAKKDWPGGISPVAGGCRNSAARPDKVLFIEEGRFYGHANLARGPTECAWIDPFTDKTGLGEDPPMSYRPPLRLVESSVTGIKEYRGSHFCGILRGNLILSTYKGGVTYRMSVTKDRVASTPEPMIRTGGITFVENAHGDLIFPRFSEKTILFMSPIIRGSNELKIYGLVPWRHGLRGGTILIVGGSGFSSGIKVTIGEKSCSVVSWTSTEVRCKVPEMASGGSYDLSVQVSDASTSLTNAVLYMNV